MFVDSMENGGQGKLYDGKLTFLRKNGQKTRANIAFLLRLPWCIARNKVGMDEES